MLILLVAGLCLLSCGGRGYRISDGEQAVRRRRDSIWQWLSEGGIRGTDAQEDSVYAGNDKGDPFTSYYYHHDKGSVAQYSGKKDKFDREADTAIAVLENAR